MIENSLDMNNFYSLKEKKGEHLRLCEELEYDISMKSSISPCTK